MSAVTLLVVATTVWGVVMAVSPLLQIRRIRRTGSSLGVSSTQVSVIFFGNGLWLAYGLVEQLPPLIVANVLSLICNGVWLLHILRFRPWPVRHRTPAVVGAVRER